MYLRRVIPDKYFKEYNDVEKPAIFRPPFDYIRPVPKEKIIDPEERRKDPDSLDGYGNYSFENSIYPKLEDTILTDDLRNIYDERRKLRYISPPFISISSIGEVKENKEDEEIRDFLAIFGFIDFSKRVPTIILNKDGPVISAPDFGEIFYFNNKIYIATRKEFVYDVENHRRISKSETRIMEYPTLKEVFGSPYIGDSSIYSFWEKSNEILKPQYDLEHGEFVYLPDELLSRRILIDPDGKSALLLTKERSGDMAFISEDGRNITGWHTYVHKIKKEDGSDAIKTIDYDKEKNKLHFSILSLEGETLDEWKEDNVTKEYAEKVLIEANHKIHSY